TAGSDFIDACSGERGANLVDGSVRLCGRSRRFRPRRKRAGVLSGTPQAWVQYYRVAKVRVLRLRSEPLLWRGG
ncbi:MAG TPA: hypothetical protein VFU02_16285, partial [Polyangiaceae bacterium]|nr:hypothetical protein [Polyangiaceae bacterium]